jgi:aminoglycoside phosphotransferase (APT) family kinase protein
VITEVDSDILCVLRLAFGRHIDVTPIPVTAGHGERGLAYALHGEGVPRRVLLQRYSPREQPQAFRAFSVMRALHDQHFPVPDVYYLGWSYYMRYLLMLVEHVEGRGFEGQPHAFFARVGPHFAETLARLHRLNWEPLPDVAMLPFRYAFREMVGRVRRLETPQLLDILDWLMARGGRIVEMPYTVTHGDYSLQNVLADRTQIVTVQNWEHAVLADPRFDVGHTSALLGAHGIALSDQFLESYLAVAGPVPDLLFWEIFGALRLLSRTALTLSTLPPVRRDAFLAQWIPAWRGLLMFVTHRTGMDW